MKSKKVRITLINIHGLLRGHDLELGRDLDTGGQTKYVLEFANSLSQSERVEEVTILTRMIVDKKVSKDYSLPVERINSKAKIVRIPCGPKRYLKKESLWLYLDNFIDRALNYFKREGKLPHIIHGHYADAGYVGSQLSSLLQIPFVFTGHSLGRVKKQRLLDKGRDLEKIITQYRLNQRIEAEEIALDNASMVVTSTLQEVEEQYSLYEQYQPGTMEVIPPGVDLNAFNIEWDSVKNFTILDNIKKFLTEPDKPVILSIARPDERKNLSMLIKAYGESRELQEAANLVLIIGSREKIDYLEPGQKRVIYNIFSQVDDYNLYGKIAYPKEHKPEDIAVIYKWASRLKGVFINPALTEPFGLTLLESAASSLPVVATNDGGPRDILALCNNGVLIDPLDMEDIQKSLLRILSDKDLWEEFSKSGYEHSTTHYTWDTHREKYLDHVFDLLRGIKPERFLSQKPKRALPDIDKIVITDVDNTLTGDDEALKEYIDMINNSPDNIGFGIATGRSKESALEFLNSIGFPKPQILIASVGTEIYYGENLVKDESWEKQISDSKWDAKKIVDILSEVDGLKLQGESAQSKFKVSFILDRKKIPKLGTIRKILRNSDIRANVILSMESYLDIIPVRAGDGVAMRQLSYRWGIPWDSILVIGDSGNDESMLKGDPLGVVVGNYSKELEKLKKYSRIYFAKGYNARGILEGIEYYNFLGEVRIPNNLNEQ